MEISSRLKFVDPTNLHELLLRMLFKVMCLFLFVCVVNERFHV